MSTCGILGQDELSVPQLDANRFTDIFFVGDVHGSLDVVLAILIRVTGVCKLVERSHSINSNGDEQVLNNLLSEYLEAKYWVENATVEWVPSNCCLVFVGDMMDRYKDFSLLDDKQATSGEVFLEEALILHVLNILAAQATHYNSRLIKLLGNHEMNNMFGDHSAVTPFAKASDPRRTSASEFVDDGFYSKLLQTCGSYPAIRIGPFIAMHGGLDSEWAEPIEPLFRRLKNLLDLAFNSKAKQDLQIMSELKKYFFDSNGLMWQREQSSTQQLPNCQKLEIAFEKLGMPSDSVLIVAHSPQCTRPLKWSEELWTLTEQCESRESEKGKQLCGPWIPLVKAKKEATQQTALTAGCVRDGKPRLFLIDVCQSRLFDGAMTSSEDMIRRPAVLWFSRRFPLQENIKAIHGFTPRFLVLDET